MKYVVLTCALGLVGCATPGPAPRHPSSVAADGCYAVPPVAKTETAYRKDLQPIYEVRDDATTQSFLSVTNHGCEAQGFVTGTNVVFGQPAASACEVLRLGASLVRTRDTGLKLYEVTSASARFFSTTKEACEAAGFKVEHAGYVRPVE